MSEKVQPVVDHEVILRDGKRHIIRAVMPYEAWLRARALWGDAVSLVHPK